MYFTVMAALKICLTFWCRITFYNTPTDKDSFNVFKSILRLLYNSSNSLNASSHFEALSRTKRKTCIHRLHLFHVRGQNIRKFKLKIDNMKSLRNILIFLSSIACCLCAESISSIELNRDNFESETKGKNALVIFYSPG